MILFDYFFLFNFFCWFWGSEREMDEIKGIVAEAVSKEMECVRNELSQLKHETENLK